MPGVAGERGTGDDSVVHGGGVYRSSLTLVQCAVTLPGPVPGHRVGAGLFLLSPPSLVKRVCVCVDGQLSVAPFNFGMCGFVC